MSPTSKPWRTIVRRKAAALAAGAVALGGLTVAAAPPAAADGCLRVVGKVLSVKTNAGYQLGYFYQGYDQCNNRAYAEFHFTDTWVSQVAAGSSITIIPADGWGGATTGDPKGTAWWDALWAPLARHNNEVFTASFSLNWNGNSCSGSSTWDYHDGQIVSDYAGGADCEYQS